MVAKVEFHFGELFPRVGFIVTNLTAKSRALVRFYNKRGTAEQWIKESKQAVAITWLSCHRFRANEVRLWLSVLSYNLGNLWRRLALPKATGNWSLTSLQQRLANTGERSIKHARYYWLLLAKGHLTRRLFAGMLRKIAALPVPAGVQSGANFDDDAGGCREVWPESMGKRRLQPSGSPPNAKPATSLTTGNTAEQNRLSLAQQSRSRYRTSWNWKVKKEILVEYVEVSIKNVSKELREGIYQLSAFGSPALFGTIMATGAVLVAPHSMDR